MPGGNQKKMKMKLEEKEEELLSAGWLAGEIGDKDVCGAVPKPPRYCFAGVCI